jgi:hypothetical protein
MGTTSRGGDVEPLSPYGSTQSGPAPFSRPRQLNAQAVLHAQRLQARRLLGRTHHRLDLAQGAREPCGARAGTALHLLAAGGRYGSPSRVFPTRADAPWFAKNTRARYLSGGLVRSARPGGIRPGGET